MSRVDGWGLLLLWALGWGIAESDGSSFVPSPDAIWSFACILLIAVYSVYSRRVTDRANRGDDLAAQTITLPVYRGLLCDLAIGMCALCLLATAVVFAANLRSGGAIYVLGILNLFRWFVYELIAEGVGLFFTQRTLGRRALLRALAPASIWAGCYAILNVVLLAVYFDSSIYTPRFVVAALNFAVAAVYGIGPLGLNYGRPALRPYAWFTVIQRCITGVGLVLSAFPPSGFSVLVFDLILMTVQVVGFPLAILAAVRADSQYWRGMSRMVPDARPGILAVCAAALCGVGDVGTGLGLRGAEESSKDHALVLRRSRTATLLRWAGWALRCRCFDGSCIGRGLLRLFTGARFSSTDSRERHAEADAPLLSHDIDRKHGGYGGFGPPSSDGARPRRASAPLHPSATAGLGPSAILSRIVWPTRALIVACFVVFQLLVEAVLAPLEAWLRLASRAPLAGDSDSEPDSDEASEMDGVAGSNNEGANSTTISRSPPRRFARSCMRFLACCGVDVNPRKWCRWRCGDLRGFEDPATIGAAHSSNSPAPQQRSMLSQWRSTVELLERGEGSRPSPGDPLDILLEFLDDVGEALIIDFSHVRLVRHVYDGASVVVTYGLLSGASAPPSSTAVSRVRPAAAPMPVAVKIGWYFFDVHAALRALQREARINKLLGMHPCIARFLGVCVCPPDVALVFQWYPRGTLREALDVAALETQRLRAAATGRLRPPASDDGVLGQYYASVRFVRRPVLGEEGANDTAAELRAEELRRVDSLVDALAAPTRPAPAAPGSQSGGIAPSACLLTTVPKDLCSWLDRFDAWGAHVSRNAGAARGTADPADLEVLWAGVTRRLGCGAPRGVASTADRRATLTTVLEGSDDEDGGLEIASPVAPPKSPLASARNDAGGLWRSPSRSTPQVGRGIAANAPARPTSADVALHLQLLRDMPFLGGYPADVTACPFWAPQDWPVDDVGGFAVCWQAPQHGGPTGTSPVFADPAASDAAAHGLRSWVARLRVARDVAAGLAHMHHGVSPPVLHLDMKPENVWLTADWRGVLGDMGEARQLPDDHLFLQRSADADDEVEDAEAGTRGAGARGASASVAPLLSSSSTPPRRPARPIAPPLTMNKGTPSYQAPEMRGGSASGALAGRMMSVSQTQQKPSDWRLPLDLAPLCPTLITSVLGRAEPPSPTPAPLAYGPPADVYGLACVLWEILTGGRPFQPPPGSASLAGARSLVEALAAEIHARPPIPVGAPLAFAHLLRCGWHPVASRRPPASVFLAVLVRLLAAAEGLLRIESVELRRSRSSAAGAVHSQRTAMHLAGGDDVANATAAGSYDYSVLIGLDGDADRVEAFGGASGADVSLLRSWSDARPSTVDPMRPPDVSLDGAFPLPGSSARPPSISDDSGYLAAGAGPSETLSLIIPPTPTRSVSIDAGAPVRALYTRQHRTDSVPYRDKAGDMCEEDQPIEAPPFEADALREIGSASFGAAAAAAALRRCSQATDTGGAALASSIPADPAQFWDLQSAEPDLFPA